LALTNPWAIPRKPRRRETRTFTEPGYEEQPVTLTFEELDLIGQTTVRERTEALVREYVTGLVDEDGEPVKDKHGEPVQPPSLYPLSGAGGGGVRLNRTMCGAFALLEELQAGPAEERYGLDLLLGMALHMPAAYGEISQWARTFVPGLEAAEAAEGDDPPSASAASSETTNAGTSSASSSSASGKRTTHPPSTPPPA
jgi:hypothetical protein